MNNALLILFFVSAIALIAGLIKPVWVKLSSRKRVGQIVGGLTILFFVLFAFTIPPTPQNVENNPSNVSTTEGTAPPPPPTTATPSPEIQQLPKYTVTKVVDGDTLSVDINGKVETIRLIGINTPETVDPRKPVECFGRESSNKAKELLTGKQVTLEKDPSQGERDKYDRLLAYIFLPDGRSFNKLMIEEGYAHEYTYDLPYKYQVEYKQAEANARANKRGLWAPRACPNPSPVPPPATITPPPPPASVPPPPPISGGHTFYLSTHYSAKYYYCDTDDGWKSLSKSYLKSYPSEAALLKDYPNQILHEPCK